MSEITYACFRMQKLNNEWIVSAVGLTKSGPWFLFKRENQNASQHPLLANHVQKSKCIGFTPVELSGRNLIPYLSGDSSQFSFKGAILESEEDNFNGNSRKQTYLL